MVDIYHQLGHRYTWNLESLRADRSGTGVICAPRYMKPEAVESLPVALKRRSFFDPQFFLPASKEGHLPRYDFYPNVVARGFTTADYGEEEARESARLCLEFQSRNEFRYAVIPTRYREGSPSDFIESQVEMFVDPFLAEYRGLGIAQPLMLQLVLNDQMLKDEYFRNRVLSWVTGIAELSGIYIVPHSSRTRKQVDDIDYLIALLDFVWLLHDNDLDVVIGYLNTEALPLLVAEPSGVTVGSYENLRMFRLRPYESGESGVRRGPNARVYFSRLLQSVDYQYMGAIRRATQDFDGFVDDTSYRIEMFKPEYNWHFSKPQPYMHHFAVFAKQLGEVGRLRGRSRFRAVLDLCEKAADEFRHLEEEGVVFDADSDGHHLARWITALNFFGKERGLI